MTSASDHDEQLRAIAYEAANKLSFRLNDLYAALDGEEHFGQVVMRMASLMMEFHAQDKRLRDASITRITEAYISEALEGEEDQG